MEDQLSGTEQYSAIIIEPFYGGSHKQLIDVLQGCEPFAYPSCLLLTLPAKKWKWRLRTAALHFTSKIPKSANGEILFASSMLNLSELLAIRPDLTSCKKILYFHENQFEYPNREKKERDGLFGWNQFLSCLAADIVLWNSSFNLTSFLSGLKSFLNDSPKDQRPDASLIDSVVNKSHVVYFPLYLPPLPSCNLSSFQTDLARPLHIVWNHRWEWDKGPDVFFAVISKLAFASPSQSTESSSYSANSNENTPVSPNFFISVIGESFGETPPIFTDSKKALEPWIKHWGFMPTKHEYFDVLFRSDIVVSTTFHEFFGVSVLEAAWCGAFPLVPNRLVFPELFPDRHIYNTDDQLAKKLRYWIKYPEKLRRMEWKNDLNLERLSVSNFQEKLKDIMNK